MSNRPLITLAFGLSLKDMCKSTVPCEIQPRRCRNCFFSQYLCDSCTTVTLIGYFNFVGRFVPPAFGEVELTPEELEEIRKREERKDRLHQNYLKRKASGAQKRYEDKIKGRKKAEIEAKKAAIRAEDIAKGVFVPVSSLPQREPMKGVQTA